MSPAATSAVPAAPALDYLRTVRRLRATYGNDPPRLQVALRDLSRRCDAQASRRAPQLRREHVTREILNRASPPDLRHAAPGSATIFSSRVEAALSEGVLRFSDRQDLLREASRMGIPRFEATLLIAAVQHRATGKSPKASYTLPPASSLLPYAAALFVVALQSAIAAAVWWVIHA